MNLTVSSFLLKPGDFEHEKNRPIRYLGKISAIRRRNFCPLCRLFSEIADRPTDQRTPSSRNTVDGDDPTCYARWVIDGQEDLGEDPQDPGEHIYQPRTRRLLVYSEPQCFKDGYVVLLAEDAPKKEFLGRKVLSQDQLDADMMKSWLKSCETTHGKDCGESLVHLNLLSDVKETLRAIDVDQMCIVELPQNGRFVALSYLWGKNFEQLFTTSANLAALSTPGALNKDRPPRTIRDAIKLTRMLGERYLWTDSLALLHDDGFQYHDEWIYARSALTIVAGSGKDANAGLPGVRKESRTFHQKIEEVKPGLKLMVSHLAEDYISTSQWDSRAWTFCERVLSRRCLLFVNGRIYFQCRRVTLAEDMEPAEGNGWSLDSIDMPTRIFREKPFTQFTSSIELYTRRELTNRNDILNAFDSMRRVLELRLDTPIFFGLFEKMIDSSLLWESNKKLFRRPGFPSWSWAGWVGEIQFKFFNEPAESWIEWRTAWSTNEHQFPTQSQARIQPPVPRQKKIQKHMPRKLNDNPPPLLHFETVVAHFNLIDPFHIHKLVISPLRKRLTGPSALSTVRPAPADPGLIRAGIADRNGQWCGVIDLDEMWMSRISQPLEFLVMSKVSTFSDDELLHWEGTLPDVIEETLAQPGYGVYNVMLVRNIKGIRFREGLGRILVGALDRALDPGAVWEDILLA